MEETTDTTHDAEHLNEAHDRANLTARARLYLDAPKDFSAFIRSVMKDEETRERLVLADHHFEWLDHVDRCEKAGMFPGILAPPSSGKSSIFGIAYPLWRMGRNPRIRSVIVGSDEDLVKQRVTPAKDCVQYDVDYRTIFPQVAPDHPEKWGELKFTVKRPRGIKDPTYQGRTITNPPMGARIDLLINDDICTYKNTISEPTMRQKIIDTWFNGFDTRISPKSVVVHIGGVIHQRDLNMALVNDPRFWFLKQSVGDDFSHILQEDMRTGERKKIPLWSRAWTPEFLEKKAKANIRSYKRAYQHIGYSDEERTFTPGSITGAIRQPPSQLPERFMCFTGVDLSGKNRKGNVIATVAVLGKRTLIDIQIGAWSSDETARRIIQVHKTYRPIAIVVENNAYQSALIDWLNVVAKDDPLPIEPFTTGKQKADEEIGLPGLAAEFSNGMWELPFEEGHAIGLGCECPRCLLYNELMDHPFGTSDTVMALWFARFGIVRLGMPTAIEFVAAPQIGKDRGKRAGIFAGSRLERFRRSREKG